MNINLTSNAKVRGVTLIELTAVIGVIIALSSIATLGVGYYQDWAKGAQAGEDLKAVYQAQRLYLGDNPTTLVADITEENIIANLPDRMTAIPTVTDLDGGTRTIDFNQSPPVLSGGYDPTGPGDSLWDAGQ